MHTSLYSNTDRSVKCDDNFIHICNLLARKKGQNILVNKFTMLFDRHISFYINV